MKKIVVERNLPLAESGEETITSGVQTGQTFHTNSSYSYYWQHKIVSKPFDDNKLATAKSY